VAENCGTPLKVSSGDRLTPAALSRLLGLCGLGTPPRGFSYRLYTSAYQAASAASAAAKKRREQQEEEEEEEQGEEDEQEQQERVVVQTPAWASFSADKKLSFFEYLDLANAYISDGALCHFQRLFHIVPSKEQVSHD
jgi:hypothetical protein